MRVAKYNGQKNLISVIPFPRLSRASGHHFRHPNLSPRDRLSSDSRWRRTCRQTTRPRRASAASSGCWWHRMPRRTRMVAITSTRAPSLCFAPWAVRSVSETFFVSRQSCTTTTVFSSSSLTSLPFSVSVSPSSASRFAWARRTVEDA